MSKHVLYLDAFINTIANYRDSTNIDNKHRLIKQAAYYGVKAIITKPQSVNILNKAPLNFEFVETVKALLSTMRPGEFINTFPITKKYNGAKYEMKDYFYTIDYMNTLDSTKIIGGEIDKLLWEYQNWDITLFNVKAIGYLDDMRRLRGQPNVMDEFLQGDDVSIQQEPNKKEWPNYLKLIK